MRWLLIIVILLLAAWQFLPEPEPVPAEESIVGEPVRALRAAEGVEETYLEAEEARKQQMEAALDEAGGD